MLGALLLLFLFPQLHPPQCHFQPFSCPGRSTLTSRCEKAWRTLEPFHQDREALRAVELPHRSKIQPKFLLNEPCGSLMCVFGRTTESLRLEKTSRIIKSSCKSITTMPTDHLPNCHIYMFLEIVSETAYSLRKGSSRSFIPLPLILLHAFVHQAADCLLFVNYF